MLDKTLDARVSEWKGHLSYGDIVRFRFPVSLPSDQDKPKVRPCLVLDTEELLGEKFAWLAYGTSANTNSNRGYEIRLGHMPDVVAAGLKKPTRFVGARRILVSLENSGFVCSSGTNSPIVGRLTGGAFDRLNSVRARIQAEADIRSDRIERGVTLSQPVVEIRNKRRRAISAPQLGQRRHRPDKTTSFVPQGAGHSEPTTLWANPN